MEEWVLVGTVSCWVWCWVVVVNSGVVVVVAGFGARSRVRS